MIPLTVVVLLGLSACASSQTVPPQDERQRVAALIHLLENPDVDVRDQAMEDLRKAGPAIEPILREHLSDGDPEVVARCGELLSEFDILRNGRTQIVGGRVFHVDPKLGFLLIKRGRVEGLNPGTRFRILRDQGADQEPLQVAIAEFEKYIGEDAACWKLRVTEGESSAIRVQDTATATVRIPPPAIRVRNNLVGVAPARRPNIVGKVALVDVDRGLMAIDIRVWQGIKVGDRLQVVREGKKVGVLVVSDVQAWGSWVKTEGDSRIPDFQKGDQIEPAGEK